MSDRNSPKDPPRHCANLPSWPRHGLVRAADLADLERVASRYAVAGLTPDIAALIDVNDPTIRSRDNSFQRRLKLSSQPGEHADPIGDRTHSPVAGIVHRYPDRVLLKLVHVCAVYCRFCFRREMVGPGKESTLPDAAYGRATQLHQGASRDMGGDPDRRRSLDAVAAAALRHHGRSCGDRPRQDYPDSHRVPVADPRRVSAEMVAALKVAGATCWVALHATMRGNLTDDARAACARLIDAGIPMVSQSVLLRGVNDHIAALEDLMRAFVECRIKPIICTMAIWRLVPRICGRPWRMVGS